MGNPNPQQIWVREIYFIHPVQCRKIWENWTVGLFCQIRAKIGEIMPENWFWGTNWKKNRYGSYPADEWMAVVNWRSFFVAVSLHYICWFVHIELVDVRMNNGKKVMTGMRMISWLTGCLHVPIVRPTGRSDWSVRLVGPTIVSCKRFVRPVGQTVGRIKRVWFRPTADPTVEACGHYVRLVGPTGQSDDQSRCSVGGIIIS